MRAYALAAATVVLLAGCGGSGSDSSTKTPTASSQAQSKQLQRSSKAAVAADYSTAVQALYVAYFGRPADPTGLVNFENALLAAGAPTDIQDLNTAYATNASVQALINSFGTSNESQTLYGSGTTSAFVTAIFENVLGRTPQQAGLTYWVNAISSGTLTQGNAALSIMAGALANVSATNDSLLVNNRLSIADYFTAQVFNQNEVAAYSGSSAGSSARTMLSAVNSATDVTAYQTTATLAAAALSPLTASCTPGQLTLGRYNAVTVGLTLSQVSQIFGCGADTTQTATNTGGVVYTWDDTATGYQSIAVNFNTATGLTANVTGNTVFDAQANLLSIIDNQVGTGATAVAGSTVSVNYTGWLYSATAVNNEGAEFDSSASHGQAFSFTLGAGQVITGWDEGVAGMRVGGTRTLIIPSALAYGSTAVGTIPANSTLVFTIQLLSVN
jgi:FKBP-type peptidyl-prolyl cis-trans isomerase